VEGGVNHIRYDRPRIVANRLVELARDPNAHDSLSVYPIRGAGGWLLPGMVDHTSPR